MPIEKFRIKSPTIGLFKEDGRQVAHMVPKGAVVLVDKETLGGENLVEAVWDEREVVMFPQDIRARGEKID